MNSKDLRRYLSELGKRLPAASGKNLSEMLFDCAYAVEASRLFTQIKASRTGDPNRLVEVRCQTRASSDGVISEVEKLWDEELRYQHKPEFHCVTVKERKVIFNGVTETARLHFVTVQIVVTLP